MNAGEELVRSAILCNERDGVVNLYAQWVALDKNERINSANFYINLACEIADNTSSGFQPQPEENFTRCIYTAPVLGADDLPIVAGQKKITFCLLRRIRQPRLTRRTKPSAP